MPCCTRPGLSWRCGKRTSGSRWGGDLPPGDADALRRRREQAGEELIRHAGAAVTARSTSSAARSCWVGAIDLGRNPQTGGRVRRKVSAPTKDESAREKLAELWDEHRRTGTVARRDTTVEQVVADWLANPPPEVRSPISRRCNQDAGGRIVEAIGKVKVVTLSPGQVERLLTGMVRDGYAT